MKHHNKHVLSSIINHVVKSIYFKLKIVYLGNQYTLQIVTKPCFTRNNILVIIIMHYYNDYAIITMSLYYSLGYQNVGRCWIVGNCELMCDVGENEGHIRY